MVTERQEPPVHPMTLTPEQQTQFDRLRANRKRRITGQDADGNDIIEGFKNSTIERLSADEIRAVVNIESVSWGSTGATVNYSPENDYTAAEQARVERAMNTARGKWAAVAGSAAGQSDLEDRVAALEAAGGR